MGANELTSCYLPLLLSNCLSISSSQYLSLSVRYLRKLHSYSTPTPSMEHSTWYLSDGRNLVITTANSLRDYSYTRSQATPAISCHIPLQYEANVEADVFSPFRLFLCVNKHRSPHPLHRPFTTQTLDSLDVLST